MSIRVMSLVWEHSRQKGNELLLLLAIADFADDNGVAFPSVKTLAAKSRMSERNTHYVIKALVACGELEVAKGAGSRKGTNRYQIHVEPTLQLFDEATTAKPAPQLSRGADPAGGASLAGVQPVAGGGVQQLLQSGGATAIAPEPSLTVSRTVTSSGGASPTPVARAFKAYAEGIKRKYNADYPPSAKANGQLANVVARVGGDNVEAVVGFYLGHQDKFYGRVKHSLDYLVRDCEKLWLELQAASGSAMPAAPTHARVGLLAADGHLQRELGQYPAGEMEAIAKKAAAEYASMIARLGTKYVAVRQGADRRQFSVEELRA